MATLHPSEYAFRARRLRSFGFAIAYRPGRKNSPAEKSAVTRLFERHKSLLVRRPGRMPMKFFRVGAAQRKIARKILSPEAMTPTGFALQVPRGVRSRDYQVKLSSRPGVLRLEENIRGRTRQHGRIIRPNTREMILDPRGHIVEMVRLARADPPSRKRGRKKMTLKGVRIRAGGNAGDQSLISPSDAAGYVDDIWDRFVGDPDEYDFPEEYGDRAKEFTDTFQLEEIWE